MCDPSLDVLDHIVGFEIALVRAHDHAAPEYGEAPLTGLVRTSIQQIPRSDRDQAASAALPGRGAWSTVPFSRR